MLTGETNSSDLKRLGQLGVTRSLWAAVINRGQGIQAIVRAAADEAEASDRPCGSAGPDRERSPRRHFLLLADAVRIPGCRVWDRRSQRITS
jgi:hypothetical protein